MSSTPKAKAELRRSQYKAAVDAEGSRRRREDSMVKIRKDKREERLTKKRGEVMQAFPGNLPASAIIQKKRECFPAMVSGIWSEDSSLQFESINQIRELLYLGTPIDQVVQSGVVPRFVEFLRKEDNPRLQLEAAFALTTITSGASEHTKVVIDHEAVPILIHLLSSPSHHLRDQAISVLGNIAGDSLASQDYVLRCGALMPLLAQMNEQATLPMLRAATWALLNFCRGQPQFDLVKPALPVLQRLLHSIDDDILVDACWALSYISHGSDSKIQAMIDTGVTPRLAELLLHPLPTVLFPALRSVGNMVSGTDAQTQFVIDNGVLPRLATLLSQDFDKTIKGEACWIISNVTAGTKEQIQAVIDAGLVSRLINLLQTAEFDIKKEAAWAVSNATSDASPDQIKYLVEEGCIKPFCDLLECPDPRIIAICLGGLKNILKAGEVEKKMGESVAKSCYTPLIADAEGIEKIEKLQCHENEDICERAIYIVETYWLEEEEEEEETVLERDSSLAKR